MLRVRWGRDDQDKSKYKVLCSRRPFQVAYLVGRRPDSRVARVRALAGIGAASAFDISTDHPGWRVVFDRRVNHAKSNHHAIWWFIRFCFHGKSSQLVDLRQRGLLARFDCVQELCC